LKLEIAQELYRLFAPPKRFAIQCTYKKKQTTMFS